MDSIFMDIVYVAIALLLIVIPIVVYEHYKHNKFMQYFHEVYPNKIVQSSGYIYTENKKALIVSVQPLEHYIIKEDGTVTRYYKQKDITTNSSYLFTRR